MKKFYLIMIISVSVFLFASCNNVIEESDAAPPTAAATAAFHAPSDTKIFNDFSAQLPEFAFKNAIVESYDEAISYEFTVTSNSVEFNAYVGALKANGFNGGTEGVPISGEGYYKATNSDRYMVEAVLRDGANLTVIVTRP